MRTNRRRRCSKAKSNLVLGGTRVKSVAKIGIAGLVVSALGASAWLFAQDRPVFRVKVDMVVLSFQVTDNKGKYVNNLKPKDFRILEDGIPQKVATFGEGSKAPMQVAEDGSVRPLPPMDSAKPLEARIDAFVGTNVFVLFDTSNYMYRGFVYASDAIADFVRGLDRADSVAVYTYSRNLTRAAQLGKERNAATGGLPNAVAADESALCR